MATLCYGEPQHPFPNRSGLRYFTVFVCFYLPYGTVCTT